MLGFEPVIGLEIHVQLDTDTKLFCADPTAFDAEPNTATCPVCLGLPGALPVTNGQAVRLAVRAALALDCAVQPVSRFARKHYFYPDLAKGYQITQHDQPLGTGGWLLAPGAGGEARKVRIRRVHLEEDAGRSLHDRFPDRTALDFNRAGVPLIEIVTEPDLTKPSEARALLVRLKQLLQYLDVSDCEMEKGSLRVDANVSVRRVGDPVPGARTELKNMNSFSGVERALEFEIQRQTAVLRAGGELIRETRQWDASRSEARPTRTKEETADYRYMAEPDLPPLVFGAEWLAEVRAELPEPPEARAARLSATYGLPDYDAGVLTATRELADYFEALAAATPNGQTAARWVMTEVLGWLNREGLGIGGFPVPPKQLAELVDMVHDRALPHGLARDVMDRMARSGGSPSAIVDAEGYSPVRDPATLDTWVADVVRAHPHEVRRCREGEAGVLNFLIGRVMAAAGGRADARRVRDLLQAKLSE